MTTPHRAALVGSSASSSSRAGSPPASPRRLQTPDHRPPPPSSSSRTLPRRAPSAATSRTSSSSRLRTSPGTPRPLRIQVLTRLASTSTSTPRTRLARGGPPRVSVRAPPPPRPPPAPPTLVRYHYSTLIILALYLPLLVVPWVLLCVLSTKPLTWYGVSYASAGWYTPDDLAWVPRWVRASNIVACVASALAYPVVGTVAAHAGVAAVQNTGRKSAVNARDLLAIADGCWGRIGGERRMWLATAGSTLLVLAMILPLLQVSAVRVESNAVAACTNVPYPHNKAAACHEPRKFSYTVGGYDPEPADMALAPGNLIARKVRAQLPTLSTLDGLGHIWPEVRGQGDNWATDWGDTFYFYQKTSVRSILFYVSALPQTINTGVLREHAIRFNSSVTCEEVAREDFPDVCSGTRPLAGAFENAETQNRFCVPGDYASTPWTISRNRQDIVEELWVDNYIPFGSLVTNRSTPGTAQVRNLTVHCTAGTTRGYFELPNNHNGGQAGEVLQAWPSQAVLEADFNDVEVLSVKPPAESNPHNQSDVLIFRYGADPFDAWNQTTPGPLATLINAMLGAESWLFPIQNASTIQEERDAFLSACLRGLPFSTYTGYFRNGFASANLDCSFLNYPNKLPNVNPESYNAQLTNDSSNAQIVEDVSRMVAAWFSGFAYNTSTEDALAAGMYLANEALLTLTVDASRADSARPIYTSNGTAVLRPIMRNPSKAVVSFLLLAEMAGLAFLAAFIYRMPTFAVRLDSVHVATVGAQLGADVLPPLALRPRSLARARYLKALEGVDGLVGVQEAVELAPVARSAAVSRRTSATLTPGALLGGGHGSPPAQPQGGHSALLSSASPPASVHGSQARAPAVVAGGATNAPRPAPRAHSFASTVHTADDDDITSALDAVSEVHDPDGPPKYGDVVQADAERAATTAAAAAAQSIVLVVGGSGRITRAMARKPPDHGVRRAPRRSYDARPRPVSRPPPWGLESRLRSARSSVVSGQFGLRSSRTA